LSQLFKVVSKIPEKQISVSTFYEYIALCLSFTAQMNKNETPSDLTVTRVVRTNSVLS